MDTDVEAEVNQTFPNFLQVWRNDFVFPDLKQGTNRGARTSFPPGNPWMKVKEGNEPGSQELQVFVIFFIDSSNPEQEKKPWKDHE